MNLNPQAHQFHAIGVSYKKADASTRGLFSLDATQINSLLEAAQHKGFQNLLVLTTCNRTEIYGWAENAKVLEDLLINHSQGSPELFEKIGHQFTGEAALEYVFRVGTGLDSQILGDFEVIGQLKKSFYQSKKYQLAQNLTERLVNAVIQASKRIKTETEISSGATSVSFASVQYIREHIEDFNDKKIVLIWSGKIVRNTFENLVKHTANKNITLINRTGAKAEKIAGKFNLQTRAFGELNSEIRTADVLIVATGAAVPTVSAAMIHAAKPLLILDLSVPKNVMPDVAQLPQVSLVHLDELSKMTDATLEKRKAFIPAAEAIIAAIKAEFLEWKEHRKHAPLLRELNKKWGAKNRKDTAADEPLWTPEQVQKLSGHIATFLKEHPQEAPVATKLLREIFQLELTSDVS